MKRIFFVLLTLVAVVVCSAQELTVKSMETQLMDTYASVHKRNDLNGTACAAVRVSLPAKGATFSGTNKIGEVTRQGADYIVFMPAGSKKMYIQHPDYHELEIVFADFGIKTLQSLATYKITINLPQINVGPLKEQVLNIKVTPKDATVLIDGVMVEQSSVKLTVGTHKYNVACKGYFAQEGTVEIKEAMPAKLVVELDRNSNSTVAQQAPAAAPVQQQTAPSYVTSNNTHAAVDLGLSVKWATCNIGANSPELYGDYFQWGENEGFNETNQTLSWATYKWCAGSETTMTKYCKNKKYGRVDNKTVLELADDVAHVKWGGTWRMPTKAEFEELKKNCTWTWTSQNGMSGYKIVSKKNGNSIFLSAAGSRGGMKIFGVNEAGLYWTSTLSADNSSKAYDVQLDAAHITFTDIIRAVGLPVRPVCP